MWTSNSDAEGQESDEELPSMRDIINEANKKAKAKAKVCPSLRMY